MLRPCRFPAFVLHSLVLLEGNLGKDPKPVRPTSSVQLFQTTNIREIFYFDTAKVSLQVVV